MEVVVDKRNQFQISRTIMELNKKRKLQAEQLDLPLPKHKFGDRNFNYDYPANNDDDELESVIDSNSFVDDCDSSMSNSAESKMDSGNAKTCPSYSLDGGSSSSSSIIIDPQNNSKLKLVQSYQDDDLYEFGNLMEYGCLEQLGMEVDNDNRYVLSSGRWTTDQGNAVTERKREDKLTIDKEFEQYFSMLML
ncbi:protein FAR-RED-ELONGATED HYPOCOTYL 1-LIKE-like isoform X2 [Impatiens glandulifera]|uniref:protein FAR-RED-ELONGATED HYPOCOTYL 1-LIKE-like isoform X2 n=1 Tax=Impatiens glandulifera TaxID=253017 RepID=UPI001FB1475E|nr:protein FAR-RED-ELONGATED HYPOCOTYL 1-LIKE-like isoform X2 [Impatiens glandulifera]